MGLRRRSAARLSPGTSCPKPCFLFASVERSLLLRRPVSTLCANSQSLRTGLHCTSAFTEHSPQQGRSASQVWTPTRLQFPATTGLSGACGSTIGIRTELQAHSPAHSRLRQEDHQLNTRLHYNVKPHLKTSTKQNFVNFVDLSWLRAATDSARIHLVIQWVMSPCLLMSDQLRYPGLWFVILPNND